MNLSSASIRVLVTLGEMKHRFFMMVLIRAIVFSGPKCPCCTACEHWSGGLTDGIPGQVT
jgi:hypothetical protein